MAPNKIPHLCGGILFGLLLEARKPRRKARNKLDGGTDGLSAPAVFNGLVKIVTGENYESAGDTNSKCATCYKSCTSSSGVYVPFNEPATQAAFDTKYKRKDTELYQRTAEFIEQYLNNDRCEWLSNALIDTMQQENIDTEIAINYSETLKVSELHTAEKIIFLPFLLSVIHYVVMNCPDCESGRPTFEKWYSQSKPRAEWKFKSDIGRKLAPVNISLDLSFPSKNDSNDLKDEETIQRTTSQTDNVVPDTRSDREVIADNLGKAFQPLIKAIEIQKSQMLTPEQMGNSLKVFGDAVEAQNHEMAEKIRENEKREQEQATNSLFCEFKFDCDRILQYCIEIDPSGQPISISLPDDIAELQRKWKFDIRKVPDSENRKLMQDILQTLSDYSYYLSDEYMRVLPGDRLIYRNESFEEGRRLRNELRPKTLELRSKMVELYKRLWPAPELDQPDTSTTGTNPPPTSADDEAKGDIVHQTVVNQYGDHPVHIDHVDNLNM